MTGVTLTHSFAVLSWDEIFHSVVYHTLPYSSSMHPICYEDQELWSLLGKTDIQGQGERGMVTYKVTAAGFPGAPTALRTILNSPASPQ